MSAQAPSRLALAGSLSLVYVVWGTTYLALRWVVLELPPFFAGGARMVIAGAVLLTVLRLRGAPMPTRRQWAWSLPVGALMFVGGNGLVSVAQRHVSSALVAVMCATMPLWAALVSRLLGEKVSAGEWLGTALGVVGVGVLASGGAFHGELLAGVLLVVSPATWALGSVLSRRWPLPKGLMSAATQLLTGGGSLLVIALLMGERPTWPISGRALGALAYLTVFGSLITFSAFTWLLRNSRPAIATSYAYVNPVVAVLAGILLGAEQVSGQFLFASALIVAGTAFTLLARAAPAPPLVVTEAASVEAP